jgi:hypothetical protein
MINLKVKRLTETAKLPTYAHDGDACFDLYADDVNEICGGTVFTCDTGLSVEVPQGYAMMIYSRSGHGFKNNMRLANCVGVLDSGDQRFLTGNGSHIGSSIFQQLLVRDRFTNTHVQGDFLDPRDLHDSLVTKLLGQFIYYIGFVVIMQFRHR